MTMIATNGRAAPARWRLRAGALARLAARIEAARAARRARWLEATLLAYPDRLLDDIGVSRAELEARHPAPPRLLGWLQPR